MIPCYRESLRLPRFLPVLLDTLAMMDDCRVLVQLVDDGSGEEEARQMDDLVARESSRHPGILIPPLRWPNNRGKGAAVYAGWDYLAPTCNLLAFVDADGAVSAPETARLLTIAAMAPSDTAVFGERSDDNTVERRPFRRLIAAAFQFLVRLAIRLPIRDTQCGIKIVPVGSYTTIRPRLKRCDFDFDIELAMALLDSRYKITCIPIAWKEQQGSHIRMRHIVSMVLGIMALALQRISSRHSRH